MPSWARSPRTPQPGNDRPRLFRLPASRALVNRMGFNNHGAAALADRLAAAGVARGNMAAGIPIGISIGKSKITPLADAAEDYLFSLRLLAPFADYLAINVSSPNTPGLRTLQDAAALAELLGALVAETWRLAADGPAGADLGQGRAGPDRDRAGGAARGLPRPRRRGPDRDQHHAGQRAGSIRRRSRPRPAVCPGRR